MEASGGGSTEVSGSGGCWRTLPGKGTGHQVSEVQRTGPCHRGRWAGGWFRPVRAQEGDLEEGGISQVEKGSEVMLCLEIHGCPVQKALECFVGFRTNLCGAVCLQGARSQRVRTVFLLLSPHSSIVCLLESSTVPGT